MISALTKRGRDLMSAVRWRVELAGAVGRALAKRFPLKKITFVAITGTAGKTTTKDLCADILSGAGAVTKTSHSLNQAVMVARTVAAIRPGDRYAVVEVSGGEPRAMDWPLRLFKPRIAVVTLVQREHARKGFGLEEIANEKFRLVNALPKDGIAILNIDDPLLRERGEQCNRKIIWVGRDSGATLRLLESRSRWPQPLSLKVAYCGEHYVVRTRLHGEHLAVSVLCALAVALAAGMGLPEAIDRVRALEPSEGRMQVVPSKDGVTFLRDDWKAPMWSLDAPLAFMRNALAPRKVMVIGTLSDYSQSASKLYPKVAEQMLDIADLVIFVGPNAFRATRKSTEEQQQRLQGFAELRQAALYLSEILRPGDLVLLKGSSKMDHLVRLMLDRERSIACWENRCGKAQLCTRCPRLYDFRRHGSGDDGGHSDCGGSQPVVTWAEGSVTLVGLGNPGEKYRHTRHNAGHIALDALANERGMIWRTTSGGQVAEGTIQEIKVVLVKPKAAINGSGVAVRHMLGKGTLCPGLVVVHDDMDLEVGAAKVRRGGGDGGHLGVRSIISTFRTEDFQRIKLGVRPAGNDSKSRQLVHQRFSAEDLQQVSVAFLSCVQQVLSLSGRNEALKSHEPNSIT